MHEPIICQPLLEVNIRINLEHSSESLEQTVWVEGLQGHRTDGTCPQSSRSFPVTLEALRDNAEVRCWHCHTPRLRSTS